MDPAYVRACGRKGGQKAQAGGYAHRWTPETAKVAGRNGGLQTRVNRLARIAAEKALVTR
jgi:general stress protein YciG